MTKYETRLDHVQRALRREKTDYVPTLAFPGPANAAYMGTTALDAVKDAETYCKAFNGVYDDMWCDCSMDNGVFTLPAVAEAFGEEGVQYFFGADRTTLTHLQKSPMHEDEYDQLIADPDKFVNEVLLPRKFPWLYNDPKKSAEKIKVYFDVFNKLFFELGAALTEDLEKNYEVVNLCGGGYVVNPVDTLFDSLRGFRGTITDMRRHKDQVAAALEVLWNTKDGFFVQTPLDAFPYIEQMPHLPAYMSRKQFEQYYWPYQKQFIEHIAEAGSKLVILLEGSWKHVVDLFRDVPKDSMVLMADDDDVVDLHDWIGDHQIITGGAKLAEIRLGSREEIIDRAKQTIDACAQDGGFLFCTDKNWISPGDVNENLVAVYNFVHEYKG